MKKIPLTHGKFALVDRSEDRFSNGRFGAKIGHKGQVRFLGYYDSPEQAAHAYNQAAFEIWGNLAPLNNLTDLSKPKEDLEGKKKAYNRRVELNSRDRIKLGTYKKILKQADKRLSSENKEESSVSVVKLKIFKKSEIEIFKAFEIL
jgi:hypothetical protein